MHYAPITPTVTWINYFLLQTIIGDPKKEKTKEVVLKDIPCKDFIPNWNDRIHCKKYWEDLIKKLKLIETSFLWRSLKGTEKNEENNSVGFGCRGNRK